MDDYILLTAAPDYLAKRGVRTSRTKMWRMVKEGTLPTYSDPLDKRRKMVKKTDLDKLRQPTRRK